MFNFGRNLRGRWLDWAITAACCQGFLLLGYDQGVMSGLIGADNQFGKDFNSPNSNLQGLIVSIYDIGCATGCLICFLWGERLGRKRMIVAGGSTMVVGAILLGTSYSLPQLLIGRIVTGIGNGFNSATIPAYQMEMCNAKNRGMLVSAQGTITIVGLCIAYWIDYGLSKVDGPVQWRFPIGFQGIFAVFLVLQMLPLPESPRYLIEHQRNPEASEILARLHGNDSTVDHPEVVFQRRQIESSIEIESAGGPFRYSELLEGGKLQNLRRMIICCAVQAMQQFTGANMINYYAPVVYQRSMNLSREMSLILGGCTSLIYLVASFIPLWTVDRFGRRPLLMLSAAGLSFCFIMCSILISVGTDGAIIGATAMIFLFQVFLGIGWLPIPWFYPAEICTTRIRARGQAIGAFVNWMSVFTIVQITPIAMDNISWKTFIIFGCFNAIWVPIVYCFFPETNQLELEDIDHLFERGGVTGGVVSTRGKTITKGFHQTHPNLAGIEKPVDTEVEHRDEIIS